MGRRRLRRGRGWGRGAGPRPIVGFIEPALLLLLHMAPMHGYGLIEGLKEIGFGQYPVDSSVIYRTLRLLEAGGTVISDWETEATAGPPRRVYQLTEDGVHYLRDWVTDLRATDAVLHRFLDAYDKHIQEGEGEHHD